MARERTPQPSGNPPKPQPHPSGEPGRKYDHLSTAGEGPGQTPLEDVVPGIILTVLSLPMMATGFLLLFPDPSIAVVAVFVPLGVVFLALGVWLIRRGSKRWAWRKANVHLTGGRYLKPWEKTPSAY